MNARLALILAFLIVAAGTAMTPIPSFAFGSSSPSSDSAVRTNADFDAGRQAIDAKDWSRAIAMLKRAVDQEPKNADAYNLLGYAERQTGNLDAAFASYDKALALDPQHRGAHEYVGEAYLQAGNLAKAEEQLKALDDICTFGCEEYTELKEKVAAYKARTKG